MLVIITLHNDNNRNGEYSTDLAKWDKLFQWG